MNILLLTERQDTFFHLLLQSLNRLDINIGHAPISIDPKEMEHFNPDIIIHNSQGEVQHKHALVIGINDIGDKNNFSLTNKNSPNYIKPFIVESNDDLEDERYKSDVVYVGNPSLLPDCVSNLGDDVVFKIINNQPAPISNYCGACSFDRYKKFFKMSKCCLLNESESSTDIYSFKLLDILYSGGNPLLYNNDNDQLMSDLKDAINGKSFRDNFMSRDEIVKNHTNKNRMSEIFSKNGLSKLSQMVLTKKDK